jgi:hypothetical protein
MHRGRRELAEYILIDRRCGVDVDAKWVEGLDETRRTGHTNELVCMLGEERAERRD